MTYRFAIYEKREHVAMITLNRPEVMNALHSEADLELKKIWTDFRDDPDLWVAIVTGSGDRAFSAGKDLKVAAAGTTGRQVSVELPPFAGVSRDFDCMKPIIAAVNGVAVAGGLELALACDIIIAAEHARFGLPEPRVGQVATDGGIQRLVRQIPQKIAMGLILTGKSISAHEAHRMGLVNEVVPLSDLMRTAKRWADELLECSPLALRLAKQAIATGQALPVDQAIRQDAKLNDEMRRSPDYLEGPRAFAEKRKPQWTGR